MKPTTKPTIWEMDGADLGDQIPMQIYFDDNGDITHIYPVDENYANYISDDTLEDIKQDIIKADAEADIERKIDQAKEER